MKRDIKLIVTDLDGTFLDDEKNIPQINIDAVRALSLIHISSWAAASANTPLRSLTARCWRTLS